MQQTQKIVSILAIMSSIPEPFMLWFQIIGTIIICICVSNNKFKQVIHTGYIRSVTLTIILVCINCIIINKIIVAINFQVNFSCVCSEDSNKHQNFIKFRPSLSISHQYLGDYGSPHLSLLSVVLSS